MTWSKLYAMARYDLRLTQRDWESIWAADLLALLERHQEAQRANDLRTAIATIWMAQANYKKTLKPKDIFPWLE